MALSDPRTRFSKASITAQNTFTTPVGVGGHKHLTLSVSGTFSATVVLQRKWLGEADSEYVDVFSTTSAVEKIIESAGRYVYRAGVKTGGYTSGTAKVALGY